MINRKLLTVTILSFCVLISFGQKKATQKTLLDVDRLYERYKDMSDVTIHSAAGDIHAHVKVIFNSNNKPSSIILYGWPSFNHNVIAQIMDSQVNAKLQAGYKYVNFSAESFEGEVVSTNVYQKGSQYAKYGINSQEERNRLVWQGGVYHEENKPKKYAAADFFYFEVGDMRRKQEGDLKKFEF